MKIGAAERLPWPAWAAMNFAPTSSVTKRVRALARAFASRRPVQGGVLQPIAGLVGVEGLRMASAPFQDFAEPEQQGRAGLDIERRLTRRVLHPREVIIADRAGVDEGDAGQRSPALGGIAR